ncbi:MAG: peptidoglycan DD-metalloendopeptidase family protein [Oscillospiraceae bacterium]|nr:peptidoglycan DD-metalloendopeptidase family protein [Oscillospiraceae bacterium]
MRQPESRFDNRGDTARPIAGNISGNSTNAVMPKNSPDQIKMINSEANSILYIPKIQSLQPLQAQRPQNRQNSSETLIKNDVHMPNSVRPNTVRQIERSNSNNNQQNADQQTVKKKKKTSILDNTLNSNSRTVERCSPKPAAQLQSKPRLLALPEAQNKLIQPDKSDIANLFLTPEEQAEIRAQSSKNFKKNDHTQNIQKVEDNKKSQDKRVNQKSLNIQNVQSILNPQSIHQTHTMPQTAAKIFQPTHLTTHTQTVQKMQLVQPIQTTKTIQKPQMPQTVKKLQTAEKTENIEKAVISETPQKAQKKIRPVKRLKNKFRKNGLNIIDSYFNAYFFYYIWKSQKKGRKVKESLNTIANHPIGWSADTSNDSVYEKNIYDKYISYMTSLSKFVGFISRVFAPVHNFFALIGRLFPRSETNADAEKNKNISELAKRTAGVILPAASMVFTVLTIINISAYKPETELWINDSRIGLVQSREDLTSASSLVETNVSALINEPYEFSEIVKYKVVLTKDPSFVSESELYNIVYSDAQNSITSAYGLYIDGKFVGAALKDTDINDVLNGVLDTNTDKNTDETVEFANDIKIVPKEYSKLDVVTEDELKNIINTSVALSINIADTTDTTDTALSSLSSSAADASGNLSVLSNNADSSNNTDINSNDTAGQGIGTNEDIAAAAASALNLTDDDAVDTIPRGMVGSLADTNDSGILARLAKSSASVSPDLIQLKKIKTETYTTSIPFSVEYVQSNKYYVGTQTVQTQGSNGQKKTTEEITYIGNSEVSREVTNVETISNPVNKVVLVGNQPKPAAKSLSTSKSVPVISGQLIRPVTGGYVTTRFGQGGHRGIDLVVPYGSPIHAADGGTIIYTGYDGSYGNHVIIQHKNGLTTLYAHMSSILVNKGDVVSQGQTIGKVGSTGNSTGPHLHFEVEKNGVLQNPESYGIN